MSHHHRTRTLWAWLLLLPLIAHANTPWYWHHPRPQGNELQGLATDGSTVLAVGVNGTALTSTDGEHWTVHTLSGTPELRAATHGDGRFVAVGSNAIYTSADGQTWTDHTPDILNLLLYDVLWTGSRYVAVGEQFYRDTDDQAIILVSADGQTWTHQFPGTRRLKGIAHNGSRLVAVGDQSTVLTSDDGGDTWTSRDPGTISWLNDVTWDGSQFIAVGAGGTVLVSPDGETWTAAQTSLPSGKELYGIAAGPQRLVAVGSYGAHIRSSDGGANWSTLGFNDPLNDVIHFAGRFVAVGVGGRIFTSDDGLTWTARQQRLTSDTLHALAYDGDRYLAVGEGGTLLTRTTSGPWQAVELDRAALGLTYVPHLLDVLWDGTRFVAVGYQGFPNQAVVMTSNDGQQWQYTDPGVTGILYGVTRHGNEYVAVGTGLVLVSSDGATWQQVSNHGIDFKYPLEDIASNGSVLVAVGNDMLYSSSDGRTWTKQTSPVDYPTLTSVTWGNDRFVAVGRAGEVLVSFDGTTWTGQDLGYQIFRTVTWDGSRFIAGLEDKPLLYTNAIYTSPDGDTWTEHKLTGYTIDIRAILSDGQRLLLAGREGIILSDQPLPTGGQSGPGNGGNNAGGNGNNGTGNGNGGGSSGTGNGGQGSAGNGNNNTGSSGNTSGTTTDNDTNDSGFTLFGAMAWPTLALALLAAGLRRRR